MAANVDEDDCCWAIGDNGHTGVRKPELGAIGNDVEVQIGVCRIMRSNGSTTMDGEDGVLGGSLVGLKSCWRNCKGDRSKVVTPVGEGGLVGWGEDRGVGLPCQLGINRCFPNTLDALVEVSGSGVLGGRLRRSRSSLLLNRNSRFVLFR